MKFIKENFLNLVLIILIVVLFLQRCTEHKVVQTPPQITIVRDTVWVIHDSTVYSKPQLIKTIPVPYEKLEVKYLPDSNYPNLVKQYWSVVDRLLAINIQEDSLKIDSIGYVKVTDTVNENMIVGRSYKYDLKYPKIKETITIKEPYKPKNQLYIGGGVSGTKLNLFDQFDVGVLFKNKKDQIYGTKVGMTLSGNVQYGIQSYWKLSLRKK